MVTAGIVATGHFDVTVMQQQKPLIDAQVLLWSAQRQAASTGMPVVLASPTPGVREGADLREEKGIFKKNEKYNTQFRT
jgi:hypothetical protein